MPRHLQQLLDYERRHRHRVLFNKPPANNGGKLPGANTGPSNGGGGGGTGDGDDDEEEDLDARIARIVNGALTNRDKRLQATITKAFEEQLAKLAPPKVDEKTERGAAPDGGTIGATKADPEVLKKLERLDALERKYAEAEAARLKAERKSARDAVHAQMKEHLDALGIKGPRARAVIHDFEASGQLRFNEDSGQYELAVKRARSRNAKPEELIFDDMAAGLKDWSATEDAKEFLPPPTTAQPGPRRQGTSTTATTVTRPNADATPSDAQLASELRRAGFSLDT